MRTDRLRRDLLADLDRLRAPEGYLYAGAPRYCTLFGRDSLISAWQTLTIDPSIAKSTLHALASFQGRRVRRTSEEEPGKILHEHRFDAASRAEIPHWKFPYYGSVDSTPLFLIVGEAYVRATGDFRLRDDLWDAFVAAYEWMQRYGDRDGDGYVEYERRNPRGLFHQGWKDGSQDHLGIAPPVALIEVQGYAVAAHRAFASLASGRGRPGLAERANRRAAELRRDLNRDFWMPDAGFFALALDGAKRPRTAITSNPAHLLATEAVRADHIRPMVERLFQEDLWTPYGLRTHASSEPDFDPYGYHTGTIWPHDNWFAWRGLRTAGFDDEALRIERALLRVHEELGKIPELYAVVDDKLVDLAEQPRGGTRANPLQAWSSGALLDMISARAASTSL